MPLEPQSVSVIVPAYNEANRIGAALESVLAQTLAPLEILVIDDGSSDATAEVAAAYPVTVLSRSNGGISAARNCGFRAATGTWLALLDADDLWLPERLEWLARAAASRSDVAFGFSDYTVEESGVVQGPSNLSRTPQFRVAPRQPATSGVAVIGRADLCVALATGNFLGTSTIFVRRELVVRHELWFDELLPERTADYQLSEDVEWYLRVLKWSDAFAIDRVLARYVRRPGSEAEAYGRVRAGDIKLGERIANAPDVYGPGAAAAFARTRREQQRHAASIHMRAADFGAARRILAAAQRERFSPRDALHLAFARSADCAAGRSLTRALRAGWKGSVRPVLRAIALRRHGT